MTEIPDFEMSGHMNCDKFKSEFIKAEVYYPSHYSRMFITPYGMLFHNLYYPGFIDGNHAVITDQAHDLNQCIHAVELFYNKRGLPAKFKSSLNESSDNTLLYYLKIGGYEIRQESSRIIVCGKRCVKSHLDKEKVEVKKIVNESIADFIFLNTGEGWTTERIRRRVHLRRFYILTVSDDSGINAIVTYHDLGHICKCDDLIIHEGKEAAGAALLRYLTVFHNQRCDKPLYTIKASSNSRAESYITNGFNELEDLYVRWVAVKNMLN